MPTTIDTTPSHRKADGSSAPKHAKERVDAKASAITEGKEGCCLIEWRSQKAGAVEYMHCIPRKMWRDNAAVSPVP